MNNRFLYIFSYISLIFYGLSNNVHAQQLEAISYRLAQGLVGERGLEVLQDSSGFIWINTSNGVSRFDGIEFRNFKEYINHLIMTDDQRILAVTNEGLKQLHYEVDSIYFETLLPHKDKLTKFSLFYPNWVYEDHQQDLWVTENETVALLQNKQVKKRYKTGAGKLFFVQADTNYMFLFSEQGDIFRYQFQNQQFQKLDFDLPNTEILTAFSPEKGKIWLGGHQVIELHVKNGNLTLHQISDNYSASFTCFLKRREGTLLAGSKDHFIYQVDTVGDFKFLKYGELAENPHYGEGELSSLYEDRDDNIWVTSTIGVALLQEPTFAHLWNLPRAYLGNVAMQIGSKKYVSVDGLFRVDDLENGQKKTVPIPLGDYISSGLTFRGDSQMVVGTTDGHILLLENEQIVQDYDFSEQGLAVFNLFVDSKNNIWALQRPKKNYNGILKITLEGEIEEYTVEQGMLTNALQIKEKDGVIYVSGIGAKTGLFRYTYATNRFENMMPDLPPEGKNWSHFEVHDFEVLENENFLLATTHGLLGINQGKMRRILANNPRFRTEIRSILSDPQDGGIWLATDRYGILKYYDDDHFYKFNAHTGVANSMSYRALKLDKNGRLWAGSAESVYYQQKEIKQQKTRKPLFISLKMNGNKVDWRAGLKTFDYDTELEATFILADYPAHQVIYEERVFHEKDQEYTPWVSYGENMRLRLPQFSEGKHIVEIRAKKVGAYEYSDILSYEFDIQKVWYKTSFAVTLFFLSIVAVLFLAYKINEKQHQKVEKKLADAITERTLEVREKSKTIESKDKALEQAFHNLQDTESLLLQSEKMVSLGELVAGIAHEMNAPLNVINTATSSTAESQHIFMKNFPLISRRLSFEEQGVFFAMVRQAYSQNQDLSGNEARHKRKEMEAFLKKQRIQDSFELADLLIDMQIYTLSTEQITLLKKNDAVIILEAVYRLALQLQNSTNIKQAIKQASGVIRALKTYTNPIKTSQKIEMDVVENIELILTIYRNLFNKGIEVHRNFQSVPRILAYPDELGQVWTNLIHNAVQAMQGKGKLELEVFQAKNWVVVKITDSGAGIPLAVQTRIFEAFFTTKETDKGTGLGLSIVRKIIDKHQGKISFDTQAGKTTFKVKLPIQN